MVSNSSYIYDLNGLIAGYGFRPHVCADDMQVQASCRHDFADDLQFKLSACLVLTLCDWMRANRLQHNTSKTEVVWSATSRLSTSNRHQPFKLVSIMFRSQHASANWEADSDVFMTTKSPDGSWLLGLSCASNTAFTARYQTPVSSCSWCHWFSYNWIREMRRSPAYLPAVSSESHDATGPPTPKMRTRRALLRDLH